MRTATFYIASAVTVLAAILLATLLGSALISPTLPGFEIWRLLALVAIASTLVAAVFAWARLLAAHRTQRKA
jgi:uncharacterized membrane protein YdjX (TVP38/TMEM64 family)